MGDTEKKARRIETESSTINTPDGKTLPTFTKTLKWANESEPDVQSRICRLLWAANTVMADMYDRTSENAEANRELAALERLKLRRELAEMLGVARLRMDDVTALAAVARGDMTEDEAVETMRLRRVSGESANGASGADGETLIEAFEGLAAIEEKLGGPPVIGERGGKMGGPGARRG